MNIKSLADDNTKKQAKYNEAEKNPILHNAGITGNMMGDVPCFYKGKYHQGADPTKDPHLDVVLGNENSKKLCTWWYANALKQLKEKYNLNY